MVCVPPCMLAHCWQAAGRAAGQARLVDGAVAVLHGPQHAELLAALALQVEDHVHDVLQHLGPRDRAVLGHVAHHKDGDAQGLGLVQQRRRALPDLRPAG